MCGGSQYGQVQMPQTQQTNPMQSMSRVSYPGFNGQTQDLGNGMFMRQMAPSMLPPDLQMPRMNPMVMGPNGVPGHFPIPSFQTPAPQEPRVNLRGETSMDPAYQQGGLDIYGYRR